MGFVSPEKRIKVRIAEELIENCVRDGRRTMVATSMGDVYVYDLTICIIIVRAYYDPNPTDPARRRFAVTMCRDATMGHLNTSDEAASEDAAAVYALATFVL